MGSELNTAQGRILRLDETAISYLLEGSEKLLAANLQDGGVLCLQSAVVMLSQNKEPSEVLVFGTQSALDENYTDYIVVEGRRIFLMFSNSVWKRLVGGQIVFREGVLFAASTTARPS